MTKERKFTLRIEEVPAIGQFIYDSYVTDEADFKSFSPQFNDVYKTDYVDKFNAVKEILNSKILTAELKMITARMYNNAQKLKIEIDRLEAYTKLTQANLKVSVADFKFKEIRKAANKKDFEGLIENLKISLQLTQDNLVALQAKGFTPTAKTAIEDLRTAFELDNAEQNRKLDQRRQTVAENTDIINTFYEKISEILAIGKVLYKKTNPEKAKSYTLSAIQKRIRNTRTSKVEEKSVETPKSNE
jgi:hypothetical protein